MSLVEELEAKLGPALNFTLTPANRSLLKQWAIAKGVNPVQVHVMTAAQLSNLYHERASTSNDATELQRIANDILIKVLQAVHVEKFDGDMVRQFVADEIEKVDLERLAEKLASRMHLTRIEIVHPSGTIQLDGMVHYMTEKVIKIASLGHPIMMVGPAGCGKTTIGAHAAKALQLPFYITSTINETHELTGFIDGYGKYHSTPFRQAFEFGGVWMADEIDAWDAAALLAANAALANGYANFPDRNTPIVRHSNFRMIAAANTFGNGADRVYVGRNELDAASLDRFATINVDYDTTLEQMFANGNDEWLHYVWKIRKRVNEKRIRHVVSSRAIIMGSAALSIGIPRSEVEETYLFKGMNKNDRDKIQ